MAVFATLRSASPRLRLALLAALLICVSSLAFGAVGVPPALSAGAKTQPKAHSAPPSYLTGIADEETEMFSDPLWKQLNTHITRYIAPYDAAVRPYSLT